MTDEEAEVVVEELPEGSEEELDQTSSRIDAKVKKLKTELDTVKKERQEYLDGWQRAKADYVNALKRFEEEKKAAVAVGRTLSVAAFLPAMDSLERAEQAGELPPSFVGIAKQLHEAAKALGLEKFGTPGDSFDPALHEALGQDLASSPEEDNRITEVYEAGWKSAEGIIRPAKVRVLHYDR